MSRYLYYVTIPITPFPLSVLLLIYLKTVLGDFPNNGFEVNPYLKMTFAASETRVKIIQYFLNRLTRFWRSVKKLILA